MEMLLGAKFRSGLAFVALAFALLPGGCAKGGDKAEQQAAPIVGSVNVYSGRHYDSDIALFNEFTRETGIKVNLIEAPGDALIERLSHEGDASPADIFITADAGVLWRAAKRGLLRPITDQEILDRVPAEFKDPNGLWVGFSKRARIIVYNKNEGMPEGVKTYLDLAKPGYRGMICIRSSTNTYNQSLLASIIAHHGAKVAEEWARGVVANFARKPQGTDTTQIEAVSAGICRLGVVNSYYVARYMKPENKEAFEIGKNVGVFFPNQETTGAHLNISGGGVAANAPHPDNAEKLLAFLLTDASQKAFALGNNEYPVVEDVPPQGPVTKFGTFKADKLDAQALGEHQAEAVEIFDRAGWP